MTAWTDPRPVVFEAVLQRTSASGAAPLAIVLCRKDVVAALSKGAGAPVTVRVELDPRAVEPPEALRAAAGWERSPSCQRAYAGWGGEAKREETRARRAAEAALRIAAGERRT